MTIIRIFQGKDAAGNPKQVGGAFTLDKALAKCRRWAYAKKGAKLRSLPDGRLGFGEGSMFTYVIEAAARMVDEQNRQSAGGRL